MLSEDLRTTLATARIQVAEGAMTEEAWQAFCALIEDIAGRLGQWERSAMPGPAARLHLLPDNVVRLDLPDRPGPSLHPPGDAA